MARVNVAPDTANDCQQEEVPHTEKDLKRNEQLNLNLV